MTEITHNNLPEAIAELLKKQDILLSAVQNGLFPTQFKTNTNTDPLFNLKELKDYLPDRPANQTIYGWITFRKVPYEKHGGRLYFRKSSIDKWLANGRQM